MGLYFFSGKGGVGKTHLATSFAYSRAAMGQKALLVEFSQFAQYSEYFETEVGFSPLKLDENFFVASWTGRDCLREYVGKVLRSQKASDFFMKIPLMEKLIHVAPGLKEISVLGKLTSDYREINFSTDFDDIIFDAPSSGHFVSLLGVPESLGGIVGVGPMKKQCAAILNCLQTHNEVYIGIVGDGSSFSKTESAETELKIKELLKGRAVTKIHNLSKAFPYLNTGKWNESAKSLSSHWEEFKWS
ncbi:MAG: ArsA-related P-loop ATPase [Bdellovibrionales bacterium]